jgi:short-subunit dehydrogenase involved in D-alanine esterification of teichoic acids
LSIIKIENGTHLNMAFTLIKDDDENLITVTYEVNTSYQDRIDLLYLLIKILENQPRINILINTAGAIVNMSSTEQLKYGDLLAENTQYFQYNRTAIVKKHVNPHPYILAEAYVEGFKNFLEFDNVNEATAWINGKMR